MSRIKRTWTVEIAGDKDVKLEVPSSPVKPILLRVGPQKTTLDEVELTALRRVLEEANRGL
jgi:hypothetical protein